MATPKKPELDENFVADQVRQIIEKLDVSATAEVSRLDTEDTQPGTGPVFFVDISSEDSSLLIGKYGANLEALQFVLVVRLKTLTGQEDFEVFVDVDGWRSEREEKLKKMAISVAEKVATTGKPEPIYNLRSNERRVIHTILTDHPQVVTESIGEGINRYLVVKPK